MKTKHLALDFDLPKSFSDVQSYDFVRVLKGTSKTNKGGKALFILDHMPSEDLENGKIFSGTTGAVFLNQIQYLEDVFPLKTTIDDWNFLVVSYNMFKTYEKSEQYKSDAAEAFSQRIRDMIVEYKPDYVMTFGTEPFKALNADKINYSGGLAHNWYGVEIPTSLKTKNGKHKFVHVPNVSYNAVLNPRNIKGTSYTLGYMSRWMLPMFQKGMPYRIPQVTCGKNRNWNLKYVTTIKGVEKVLRMMKKAKKVAVDTETENLNRIKNKLMTVQLSSDGKTAYVIPIYHRDSPFSPKELRKISDLMRDYFEENQNKYQIYVNAKFDLNVLRSNFGIRSYAANVWDIQAGEFAFDENAKNLMTLFGHGYYNLANLAMQYGTTVYYDVTFGKEKRATIADVDLDESVQEYAGLDVIVPFLIAEQQVKRAKDIKYAKYNSMVSEQISDQIHAFSIMETTGAMADIDYLFKLNLPNSPINEEIKNVERDFLNSPEVKAANKAILVDDDVPKFGLMGRVEVTKFDMSKNEHKQVLFFDVMKLKPLKEGEKKRDNGKPTGKLDKDFQEAYKDVPLVSLYNKLGKAYKLKNAYVNSLLRLWGESEDFKHDRSIRPTYSYLGVVTGRTSASDPNLQQVPSRSELGKLIKRILIARPGRLLIKVDYSAHEVRGWSIISGDAEVAEVFEVGRRLRHRYRTVPDPWIHHLVDIEGDVHKINASYFFGVPIMEVTKPIRNAVKTVIFGLIYQQGDKGLAKSTGREVEEIADIKAKFLKRFPIGLKWFEKIKRFAHEHYYVESPVGRRRHLWGFMVPESHREANMVHAACDRRAVNSPVQGFGSDLMMSAIRILDRMKYEYWKANGKYPDFALNVSVHDSLTVDCAYDWIFLALDMIERAMTSAVVQIVKERHGFEFTSVPEIDFEIGASEKDVGGWDFSYAKLRKLIQKGLEQKRDELGEKDLDVEQVLDSIMENQYSLMSDWMKKQLWANNIKIRSMDKVNPLTKLDQKNIKQWHRELPDNTAKYEAFEAEERAKKAAAATAVSAPAKKKIKIPKSIVKKAVRGYLN
ncbi:putative DNA polymerase I [Erwinia phage vB_EamM_Yoloswag]|uniref:DNA-directed DNA polymerase n=1 Tax=Erwinia phage vB_EamM_Yoloswag TaxID=1958956 RepID=A0A1S6L385_9CAUD|nr:putative DNA polymerase I [Erwinia phage vB_EamM_Yoloswag]AQT28647.1 putative DNA polymerase I [Erwinia phage vB_EamM_Yoloswag]